MGQDVAKITDRQLPPGVLEEIVIPFAEELDNFFPETLSPEHVARETQKCDECSVPSDIWISKYVKFDGFCGGPPHAVYSPEEWGKRDSQWRYWCMPGAEYVWAGAHGGLNRTKTSSIQESHMLAYMREQEGDREEKYSEIFAEASHIYNLETLQIFDRYFKDDRIEGQIEHFRKNPKTVNIDKKTQSHPDIDGDGRKETIETETIWAVYGAMFLDASESWASEDKEYTPYKDGQCGGEVFLDANYLIERLIIDRLTLSTGDVHLHVRGVSYIFSESGMALFAYKGADECRGDEETVLLYSAALSFGHLSQSMAGVTEGTVETTERENGDRQRFITLSLTPNDKLKSLESCLIEYDPLYTSLFDL